MATAASTCDIERGTPCGDHGRPAVVQGAATVVDSPGICKFWGTVRNVVALLLQAVVRLEMSIESSVSFPELSPPDSTLSIILASDERRLASVASLVDFASFWNVARMGSSFVISSTVLTSPFDEALSVWSNFCCAAAIRLQVVALSSFDADATAVGLVLAPLLEEVHPTNKHALESARAIASVGAMRRRVEADSALGVPRLDSVLSSMTGPYADEKSLPSVKIRNPSN